MRRLSLLAFGAIALAGSPATAAGAMGVAGSPATAAGAPTLAGSLATAQPSIAPPPPAPAAPLISPPPPVPAFTTWTGFYAGGQIGYAWSNSNIGFSGFDPSLPLAFNANVSSSPQGIIGGGHVGYNYQIDQFVVGIEGSVDATSLSSTVTATFSDVFGGTVVSAERDSYIQGSIRARVGYAFDRALLYATGGVAFGDFSTGYNIAGNNNPVTTTLNGGNAFSGENGFSTTRTGWTAGGGIGYAVTDNWSVFAEYRYTSFGTFSNVGVASAAFAGVTGLSGAFLNATRSLNQNQVQVGFSYKFGTQAPIVAKY